MVLGYNVDSGTEANTGNTSAILSYFLINSHFQTIK